MTNLKTTTFAILALLATPLARAEEPAPPAYSLAVWGAAAAAKTRSAGDDVSGALLIAGVSLPAEASDRKSIRFSVSRLFDSTPIDRHNLIAHFGYRITPRFGAGLLGGVQYIHRADVSRAYLKPVIGAEVNYDFPLSPTHGISVFLAYESARGSTGTLAFDGGGDVTSAQIVSLGLALAFALL